ncbi:MAG: endonuclease III [Chloroflexota bacterium]|jgi:endonuclease-3|nr:endonuclease III [Chloroflexota bacterium]
MSQPSALTAASSAEARIPEILRLLHQEYPDATCELDFRSPLELLVATILSAQCTDERVNKVTPALFAAYPTAQAYAEADIEELQEAVRPTGFFRNKSKNIQGAARRIVEAYDGDVPSVMDDLLTLPGVARKTANVVLGCAYHIADGVVVDTHVKRLSNRLGLTAESNPEKIERDLMNLVPQEEWIDIGHLLIFHGRRVCAARKPNCAACVISHLCPSAQ